MTLFYIRAIETEEFFTICLGSDDPTQTLPHSDEFPSFGGEGYDEKMEFDEPEWDDVELVFEGCPEGYVIVVFKRRGNPVLCMLYGPAGFVASYGTIPQAQSAARAHRDSNPDNTNKPRF